MEAYVPRFPTGVLDGEIGTHLTHAAVDTRISISVIMPGYAWFHARRPSRRRSAVTDDHVSANMRTPSFHTSFLVRLVLYLHNQVDINWAHGVVVSHPPRMREALGSNPSVSMHVCMHDTDGSPDCGPVVTCACMRCRCISWELIPGHVRNNIRSCLHVLTPHLRAVLDSQVETCRSDTTRTHSHLVAASSKQRSKSELLDAPMPGQYTLPGSNGRPLVC